MVVWLNRIPKILVVTVAAVFTLTYFSSALPRVFYPYDLDFLEDGVLMQALRVAQGLPVYVPPNADFNPHVYMPLFFWLSGVLIKIAGQSFVPLRLLSLASTLGTTLLLYWIAQRESRRHWIAFACSGLFLGGYAISGFWYELARVDSLFVVLTLGGLALANYAGRSNRQLLLSAVVLALAAFTKQSGFPIAAGLALYLFLQIRRRAWVFVVTFCVLTILPMLLINWLTGGWFFYHIFYIASADPTDITRITRFLRSELFGVMAGLSLMVILAFMVGAWRVRQNVFLEQPWFIGTGLAIMISGLGRYRVGGNLNDLMPAYALLCLAPAILMKMSALRSGGVEQINAATRLGWLEWLVAGLIVAQFALGRYSPVSHIPRLGIRQSGDRLIQRIASTPGRVLVMLHPYYTLLAGNEPSTQIATLWYVRHRGELPIPVDFINRIKNHYYSMIVSDESFFETQGDLHDLLTKYYYQAELLDPSLSAPTDTGVIVQPRVIFLPIQP